MRHCLLLLGLLLLPIGLSGCVVAPAPGYYARPGYYNRPYYAPRPPAYYGRPYYGRPYGYRRW
jgi:predicted N-acetyltransferase YhbS